MQQCFLWYLLFQQLLSQQWELVWDQATHPWLNRKALLHFLISLIMNNQLEKEHLKKLESELP